MIYVISKSTFGDYKVRDIQCNANWDCCPYSDYALIPESMVEGILATKGYCDITLNSAGTEVVSFTARSCPSVPEECHAEDIAATVPKTAKGSTVTVGDSGDAPLLGLKLYGKTVQNGTPTPESPVPLVSAGASGTIHTTVCGKNLVDASKFAEKQQYGITFTNVGDGGVHVGGTSTNYANVVIYPTLPKGKYTVSCVGGLSSVAYAYLQVVYADGTMKNTHIGNIAEIDGTETEIRFFVQVNPNATVDTTLYPMLEAGEKVTEFEPYKEIQTLTAYTPGGLPGIPVSSGGNYTDENGQAWICDEIDFARGKYVQRVNVYSLKPTAYNSKTKNANTTRYNYGLSAKLNGIGWVNSFCTISTWDYHAADEPHFYVKAGISMFISNENITAFESLDAVTVVYVLETPIETPLSAQELAQFAALHTNKPTTTVFNDGGADMEIRYCTPNTAVPMNLGGKAGNLLELDEHGCVVTAPKESMPFAPAGYGLGTAANNTMADLNNATKTGWYVYGMDTANTPYRGYGVVEVITRFEDETILQIAHDLVVSTSGFYNHDVSAQRRFRNGAWQPWEYINPPMIPGVEYRTTERYNGKPVYVKAVDLGTLPNATEKQISLGIGGTILQYIGSPVVLLPSRATFTGVGFYPGHHNPATHIWASLYGVNITITTDYDASSITGIAIVKYAKE